MNHGVDGASLCQAARRVGSDSTTSHEFVSHLADDVLPAAIAKFDETDRTAPLECSNEHLQ
jgi:hypothetical protein